MIRVLKWAVALSILLLLTGGFLLFRQQMENSVRAYLYAYPLVMMEVTRDATVGETTNQINHSRTFPDHRFRRVMRPNVDTLYSTIWFDLTDEPIVLELPDSEGRYYLMPILDAWTNVVTSLGSRTTGNGQQRYLVIGPNWRGEVPAGMRPLYVPTATAWAIGRADVKPASSDGLGGGVVSADMLSAYIFQSTIEVTPLSKWQQGYRGRQETFEAFTGSERRPPEIVAAMSARQFYTIFQASLARNAPPLDDAPIWRDVLAPFGFLLPGAGDIDAWAYEDLGAVSRWLLEAGLNRVPDVMADIAARRTADENGWTGMPGMSVPLGQYGTRYPLRAFVARVGLGANEPEDAIYPSTTIDSDGKPLNGDHRYRLHFPANALPPVEGFWSLTLYDRDHYLMENPIGRHALGGRDALAFNEDGSLDLYIQPLPPEDPALVINWLPSVPGADFSLMMRLYWPKGEVLQGQWQLPAVQRLAE